MSLTLEQIETELAKFNKDLSKIRGYVAANREGICAAASTNVLNRRFSKYLPDGYAFKRNYNVLGVRAISGAIKETSKGPPKTSAGHPRKIIQPAEEYESSESEYEEEEPEYEPPPKKKKHSFHRRSPSVQTKTKPIPQQQYTEVEPPPIQQYWPVSNKTLAKDYFKQRAWERYHNI